MFRARIHRFTSASPDPSISTPPSHSTTISIHSQTIHPSIQTTTIISSYKLFRVHVGILFSRPSPRISANPSILFDRKTLDYCLAFWFEMESSTETVCWRLFVISLPFFCSLLGPFGQRQPTAPPIPSFIAPSHPIQQQLFFCAVWNFCPPNRVYRICVDGMPWRPPRLASKRP